MYWKAEPRFTATQTCILLNLAVGMFWVMSQAARAAAWSQVSEQRQLRWRTQRRCNEASGQWPGGPFNFGAAAGAVSRRNGERHYCMQRRLATGKARTALARGKAREGPFIVRHIQIPGQGARVLAWLLHLNVLPVSSRPACEH